VKFLKHLKLSRVHRIGAFLLASVLLTSSILLGLTYSQIPRGKAFFAFGAFVLAVTAVTGIWRTLRIRPDFALGEVGWLYCAFDALAYSWGVAPMTSRLLFAVGVMLQIIYLFWFIRTWSGKSEV